MVLRERASFGQLSDTEHQELIHPEDLLVVSFHHQLLLHKAY